MSKSPLENKKYIIFAIIGSIVIISMIATFKFYNNENVSVPEGVGEIGSEHVHANFAVLLDWMFIDFNPIKYDKYANANDYIFMMNDGSYNLIHRHAANATLAMFFESFGIQYGENCLIIPPDTENVKGEPYERLEYCNEGDYKTRLFVNGKLNEDGPIYIIQDKDSLLIAFDNKTSIERNYSIG